MWGKSGCTGSVLLRSSIGIKFGELFKEYIRREGRMNFYVGDAMPSSQTYSSSSQFILKAGSVFMKCGSGI